MTLTPEREQEIRAHELVAVRDLDDAIDDLLAALDAARAERDEQTSEYNDACRDFKRKVDSLVREAAALRDALERIENMAQASIAFASILAIARAALAGGENQQ